MERAGGRARDPRNRPGLLALALAVALVAWACGDGETTTSAPSAGPAAASSTSTGTTSTPTTAHGTGSSGTTSTTVVGPGSTTTTQAQRTTELPEPLDRVIVPTGNPAVDNALEGVARAVEHERGLPFLEPVAVELLDDEAFERELLAGFEQEAEAIRRQQVLLQILELLPADADLVAIERQLTGEGVVGFYEPWSGRLVLRGDALGTYQEVVAAHELTHALDDQWFDLDRGWDGLDANERSLAFGSLVEGDAEVIEQAYVDSLSTAELRELDEQAAAFVDQMDLSGLPNSVTELVLSPYTLGAILVEHLRFVGGRGALDASFDDPPATSEQVLHPWRYDAREPGVTVPVPAVPGTVVAVGTLGELDLLELLQGKRSPAEARNAAEGWGGGTYVVWEDAGGSACVRIDLVADSEADLTQLRLSLTSWASAHADATVTQPSPSVVRVDACG